MMRRFFFWPTIACVFATLLVLQPYIRGYLQKATERTEKVERIENRAAIAAALPHGLKLDDGIPFTNHTGEWRPGKKTVEKTLIEIGAKLGPSKVLRDSDGLEVIFVERRWRGAKPNRDDDRIPFWLTPEPKANQRAVVYKDWTGI